MLQRSSMKLLSASRSTRRTTTKRARASQLEASRAPPALAACAVEAVARVQHEPLDAVGRSRARHAVRHGLQPFVQSLNSMGNVGSLH
mmetsp:Transcript_81882/g.162626  ORF Transcript_81882/g.162626 Transcript_81882/m.162626 type:complete len:88 (+) Transcript_81882:513-776(+)